MKIVEIDQKYFFAKEGTFELLEAYNDPNNELEISFKQSDQNPEVYYGYVTEKQSKQNVVEIVFTLSNNGVIDLGNVIPNSSLGHDKKVYTSQGAQYNGVDIGIRGLRWIKEKIKNYALSQGFDLKKITTNTRFTGARARNNPNSPEDKNTIKQFDITKPFTESVTLDFATGNISRNKFN
jgi:hypothetical protein